MVEGHEPHGHGNERGSCARLTRVTARCLLPRGTCHDLSLPRRDRVPRCGCYRGPELRGRRRASSGALVFDTISLKRVRWHLIDSSHACLLALYTRMLSRSSPRLVRMITLNQEHTRHELHASREKSNGSTWDSSRGHPNSVLKPIPYVSASRLWLMSP
jgi:hypothetical protein